MYGMDSSVGIATRCGLEGTGIEFRLGGEIFHNRPEGPGAHTASYTMCTGSFPEVQRPGCGVNPPSSPRLKKE